MPPTYNKALERVILEERKRYIDGSVHIRPMDDLSELQAGRARIAQALNLNLKAEIIQDNTRSTLSDASFLSLSEAEVVKERLQHGRPRRVDDGIKQSQSDNRQRIAAVISRQVPGGIPFVAPDQFPSFLNSYYSSRNGWNARLENLVKALLCEMPAHLVPQDLADQVLAPFPGAVIKDLLGAYSEERLILHLPGAKSSALLLYPSNIIAWKNGAQVEGFAFLGPESRLFIGKSPVSKTDCYYAERTPEISDSTPFLISFAIDQGKSKPGELTFISGCCKPELAISVLCGNTHFPGMPARPELFGSSNWDGSTAGEAGLFSIPERPQLARLNIEIY